MSEKMSDKKMTERLITNINEKFADKEWMQKAIDASPNKHLVPLRVAVAPADTFRVNEKVQQGVITHFRDHGLPGTAHHLNVKGQTRLVFSFQKQSPEIRQHVDEGMAAHFPENQR